MKHLSIRWRMTLWYSIALGVILCSFCLALLLLMRQQILVRTDAGLREEVKEIGLEIGLAPSAEAFKSQAEARFSQHDFYEFLVVDGDGGIVFASSQSPGTGSETPSVAGTPAEINIATIEFDDSEPHRVAAASMQSAFGALQVRVMRSLKPIYADLNTLKFAMAGLFPLGVALALASGYFLAGRALRSVQHVVEVANSINITSLDRRIAVENPHDEIGQLAAALNSLINRLERAVTEIRRFTADASHEIRTPIASLRSEAESALRAPRTAAEYA
ncbi:Sensor histidine kinase component HK2 [Symmachiella macrocystis]|uniref:histidine kinase n=1 Tax=Symmachiella macrocystis TaxID=2527985 RepID=A0A5C6B147_9PLAN|nr:HAMP domain-containing protein [Symmachiella macrocystis]TWU05189.1 Sensor histidine kinase component HK2 [Symmachiella macrocystis]